MLNGLLALLTLLELVLPGALHTLWTLYPECYADRDCPQGSYWLGVCENHRCWAVINVAHSDPQQPRRIP